jgi:signal transduction histidine kinase
MARALEAMSDKHRVVIDAPTGVIGHWDPRRIEEVVQNLLSNAIKYSPGGCEVKLQLTSQDGTATVLVRDQGIGIAAEDLPHVFERFYRGHRIRRLEGTGLGLHICEAIVSAHGGRIWAESEGPGKGSVFGFTLPLRVPNSDA